MDHVERPERTQMIWDQIVKSKLEAQCERVRAREATRHHCTVHIDGCGGGRTDCSETALVRRGRRRARARVRGAPAARRAARPLGGHLVDAVRHERSMHLPLTRFRIGGLAEFEQLADCSHACHSFLGGER